MTPLDSTLVQVPLAHLHESPHNPRKHFDAAALKELTDSIAKVGILTPIQARPNGKGYEIAGGARRYRAARALGLLTVPCLVRVMTDVEFLEIMTVDNLQRDDLHPLEEAQGFKQLMEQCVGYDIAKIAERCGRSHQYVYDRLRLLKLIPKAQDLFLDRRFPLSHAVLLARLSREDQERAIDPDGSGNGRICGLFEPDHGLFQSIGNGVEVGPESTGDDWAECKPVSLGEFQRWINEHVRFDAHADITQDLFPETAGAVLSAEQNKQKVVHITHDYRVADDARDANGVRTHGENAWRRADGTDKSKICAHSVLGVVVAGRGRGDAFEVCVAKKKCEIHWPAEVKADRMKAKLQSKADVGDESAKAALARQQQSQAKEAEKAKAAAALRARVTPLLVRAACDAIDDLAENKLVALIWEQLVEGEIFIEYQRRKKLKAPTSAGRLLRMLLAEDVLRHEADAVNEVRGRDNWAYDQIVARAKSVGVNVEKIVRDATAIEALKAPATPKAKAKPAKAAKPTRKAGK